MAPDAGAIGVPDRPTSPGPDRLATAVEDAGGTVRLGAPETLADEDLAGIVARGDDALRSIATARPGAPVLPTGVDPGIRSVALDDLRSALEAVLAGAATTESHPVLGVRVGQERLDAVLREVTVLTAEPARISEFAIESGTAGRVDAVRADGVVVATPAGSRGYAAAGDGPLLAPGTGLSVVPVAPFRVHRTRWVLPLAAVEIAVRRDEAAVTVEVDGTERSTVGHEPRVAIEPAGAIEILVTAESGPTFP